MRPNNKRNGVCPMPQSFKRLSRGGFAALLGTAGVLLNTGCTARQQTFASPEQAVQSLVSALRAEDAETLSRILGRGSDEIISSGDDVADDNAREFFLAAFDEKNSLVEEPDGSRTLQIGEQEWPMPIPIAAHRDAWHFDTRRGKEELLNRRIGRNELSIQQVCLAVSDAQQEYFATDHDGDGVFEFAQKFISDPGKRNGLYWETAEGEPSSPMGSLAAEAAAEGYTRTRGSEEKMRSYHGYCFKLLTSQGPHAAGGARDYIVDGNLTEGFAVVAWPVEYDSSGIMTFMVSRQGIVYERDLGRGTARIAKSMSRFDPDSRWRIAE